MVNRITINALFCLISLSTTAVGERWSRQISNAGFVNVGNDWVPLSFPVNRPGDQRQTSSRVLNYSPLPHHQPPYIPHVFQQQQQQPQTEIRQPQQLNFAAGEPFQVVGQQRYLIQQSQNQGVQFAQQQTLPNPSAQPQLLFQQQSSQQSPSSAPMQHFQQPQPSIQPPQLIQHQLPPAEINHQYQIQHYSSQQPPLEHQHNQPQQHRHQQATPTKVQQLPQQQSPHFHHQQPQFHQQQQHQQHYSFPSTPTFLENEVPVELKPHQEQLIQRAPFQFHQEQEPEVRTIPPPQLPLESQHNQEEVQLLYVPIDTLYQQNSNKPQQQPHANNKYNVIPSPVNPLQINNFYTPDPSIKHYPATTPAPTFSSPNPTPNFERSSTYRFAQQPSSSPTPKPKAKSHQPPLAMFMLNDVGENDISVNDVLSALKNAKNIDVLDSASKKSPKVFVGPSGLRTPVGYTKFELPYLSSIEQNRSERQVTKLPFFVAPLSYKAPNGFAKIPLPAPHVGSVVVNMPTTEKSQFNQSVPPPSQRTQFYPKKVQPSPSSTEYTVEKPLVYKSSSKTNLGFKFGSDVFTTTHRPYLEQEYPSSTQQTPVNNDRYQQNVVSSTHAPKKYEPFSRFQDSQSTPFYQPYTFESTTPPKKYESNFNRFQDQPAYQNSKPTLSSTAFQSPTTTNHGQENFNSFENTSPQKLSTSTPQTPSPEDYSQQNHFQTFQRNSNKPASVLSSTSFPSSTATSFEEGHFEGIINTPLKNQEFHSRNPYNTDVSAFRNFKPIPNGHVLNEEYFNVQKASDMKSFSTHIETPLNTTQIQENYIAATLNQFQPTKDYFSVPKVSQDVTISAPRQTISENVYNDAHSRLKQVSPRPEITFTSKPTEYSTRAQEIYKMKSYFREQDAFKNRQKIQVSSTSEAPHSPDSTTPQPYNFEISTESTTDEEPEKSSSPRSTVTYYTPASSFDLESAKPVVQYKLVQSVVNKNYGYKGPEPDQADITTQTYEPKEYRFTSSEKPHEKNLFADEAAVYDSSSHSPYVDYVKVTGHKKKYKLPADSGYTDEIVTTDKYTKSLYTLPSELPPISASLPGLVNSLFEDEDRESRTTIVPPTSTTVITRRTPTRGRRPQPATRATFTRAPVTRPQTTPRPSTTSSTDDDGSSSVTTTRRPISRGRRPIHYANRTTTVRTPTARNPNRVRFNPTPEERQRFRSRQQKGGKKDEENLEYQRDVLNQNYPVIQRSGGPTTTAPITITEKPKTTAMSYAHETEKYSVGAEDEYVVPPNHSASPRDYLLTTPKVINPFDIADHFAGLQDHHMQLPQEHDTGSQASYFNSEADIAAADILNSQNVVESHPVYQSSSEVIQENNIDPQRAKRPNFARRPNNGRTLTTTPTSQTTALPTLQYEKSPKERYTVRLGLFWSPANQTFNILSLQLRPKARIDSTTVQYTPKARSVRIRTRPPTTTLPTTTNAPEVETYIDESYHQINRFNKDFYQESAPQNHQPQGVRATVSPINEQVKLIEKVTFRL